MSDATVSLGSARATQLLPESHTDFILAVGVDEPVLAVGLLLPGAAVTAVLVALIRRRRSSSGEQ